MDKKEMIELMNGLREVLNEVRQYVGARYVPRFIDGGWNETQGYEGLDVVDNGQGTSYIARKPVPPGTPLTDRNYWFVYGASSGAIINLQQQIDALSNELDAITPNDRRYILLSDSYGTFTKNDVHYSWCDDVISKTGIDGINISHGDIGFRPPYGAIESFLTIIQAAVADETLTDLDTYTDIIVAGGANDIVSLKNGGITKAQLIANIAAFISYCKTTFPKARIFVGMIGNVQAGSFAYSYQECVEAYRSAVNYGAIYLNNVEYILNIDEIDSDDGIHPTPDGFTKLGDYMSAAVLDNSCDVNETGVRYTLTNTLAPSVGAWNLAPAFRVAKHNGIYTITMQEHNTGLTLDSANRLDLDNVVPSMTAGNFKLFAMGTIPKGNIKGAKFSLNEEILVTPNIPVCIQTVNNHYMSLEMPIVIIEGVMYLALPPSTSTLYYHSWSDAFFTEGIKIIYINPFSITLDVSNYNGYKTRY